jgi:hypothetical protein
MRVRESPHGTTSARRSWHKDRRSASEYCTEFCRPNQSLWEQSHARRKPGKGSRIEPNP